MPGLSEKSVGVPDAGGPVAGGVIDTFKRPQGERKHPAAGRFSSVPRMVAEGRLGNLAPLDCGWKTSLPANS
jgi:hypothetical protein